MEMCKKINVYFVEKKNKHKKVFNAQQFYNVIF